MALRSKPDNKNHDSSEKLGDRGDRMLEIVTWCGITIMVTVLLCMIGVFGCASPATPQPVPGITGESDRIDMMDGPETVYERNTLSDAMYNPDLVGGQKNLWRVPAEFLPEATAPSIVVSHNKLIFGYTAPVLDENGDPVPNEDIVGCHHLEQAVITQTVLASIDLKTGEISKATTTDSGGFVDICYGPDYIIVSNSEDGMVTVFDYDLNKVEEYHLTPPDGGWFAAPDGKSLYLIDNDDVIWKKDLTTRLSKRICEIPGNITELYRSNTNIIIGYALDGFETETSLCFDTVTGEIVELPLADNITEVNKKDQTWLLETSDQPDTYIALKDGRWYIYTDIEGTMSLVSEGARLLRENSEHDGQELYLYELDGKFVSSCKLPAGADLSYNDPMIAWSAYWDGYFLLTETEGVYELLFWSPAVDVPGTSIYPAR